MMDETEVDYRNWPAENAFVPISHLHLAVKPGDHPFHVAERAAAEANWVDEVRQKPALFNGQMVFQHRLRFANGGIEGEGYIIPYSTFLWWRRQEKPRQGFHLFCFPVPVSSDGAIIAIRMAAHTSNAGLVYCPAGSLDQSDVVNGHCDAEGNMAREVREETGLDLTAAAADDRFYASHVRRQVCVYRLFRFDRPAEALIAEIEAHMPHDDEQEIAGALAIRSGDPDAHTYNPAMLPLLNWFFGPGT